jgi:hypothetical protein
MLLEAREVECRVVDTKFVLTDDSFDNIEQYSVACSILFEEHTLPWVRALIYVPCREDVSLTDGNLILCDYFDYVNGYYIWKMCTDAEIRVNLPDLNNNITKLITKQTTTKE